MVAEQVSGALAANSTGAVGATAGIPADEAVTPEVQTVDIEEKMIKIVAMTVEKVMEKLVPQFQRP
eukprot:1319410-Karenia_brevis.AAC.1